MDYMILFPSASRSMPRFSALADAVLSQVNELINVIREIPGAYSVLYAEGTQLDAFGASVGVARPEGMSDNDYRLLLQAKLALWAWDGANDTAQGIMDRICPGSAICDNCDGTVTVHPGSQLQEDYELWPVAAGVGVVIS